MGKCIISSFLFVPVIHTYNVSYNLRVQWLGSTSRLGGTTVEYFGGRERMGTGLVVGGIILLVIGIGAYLYVSSLKAQAEQGLAECQGILGQIGQLFSQYFGQKCQQAQQYTPALQIVYYIGIAFAVIGFIMAIAGGIGIAARSARKGRRESI